MPEATPDFLRQLWEWASDPRLTLVLVAIIFILLWRGRRRARLLRDLRSEQHSQRVRGGYVAEALAPLARHFPVEVGKPGTTTVFLGQPIDYLHFDPEEGVSFIEIKSGNAHLSPGQRQLRDRIEEGAVAWHEMRLP